MKNFDTFRRRVLSLAAVTATTTVFAMVGLGVAAPAFAAPSGNNSNACPSFNAFDNYPTATNVGYSIEDLGNFTFEYRFTSAYEAPTATGVPGLTGYCIYAMTGSEKAVTPKSVGADGEAWLGSGKSKAAAFVRPSGTASNIPLDGKLVDMGSVAWSGDPGTQSVLLHIQDPAVCKTVPTCYVKGTLGLGCRLPPDLTSVAYTALSLDSVNCAPPSEAFEAQSAREFGDEVLLDPPAGMTTITSLTVQFQSYGCRDSGHWNLGATDKCVTSAPGTFDHPITATLYEASSGGVPGAFLADIQETVTIPYRPSANAALCPGGAIPSEGIEAGSQWFNTVSQTCQYSVGTQHTFTFSPPVAIPAGGKVIWTVAFDTSDYGASPLRPKTCNSEPQGCGYDSLNVGTKSYTGAPYVGTDVDPNGAFLSSAWTGAYCDNGAGGTGSLRLDTAATGCWNLYKPLGQINVGP